MGTRSRDELMSSRETAGEGAVHKPANKTTALLVPKM